MPPTRRPAAQHGAANGPGANVPGTHGASLLRPHQGHMLLAQANTLSENTPLFPYSSKTKNTTATTHTGPLAAINATQPQQYRSALGEVSNANNASSVSVTAAQSNAFGNPRQRNAAAYLLGSSQTSALSVTTTTTTSTTASSTSSSSSSAAAAAAAAAGILDRKRKPTDASSIHGRKYKRSSLSGPSGASAAATAAAANSLRSTFQSRRDAASNRGAMAVDESNSRKFVADTSAMDSASSMMQFSADDENEAPHSLSKGDCAMDLSPQQQNKHEEAIDEDWDDLDADDALDPMMVTEYVSDIFEYMRVLEVETLPNANYMDDQKELLWHMRTILVDWLIEVHNKFKLLPETLYLSVNIIDRFLSLRVVSVPKLQLVGITAMFIASKYEEVIAPSIQNFIYMADGGYTEEEILKAERYMLQVLDFSLQYPSPMSFLRRCSKADNYDLQSRTLAKYFMEITLLEHKFLDITSSMIAAAAIYLARVVLDRGPWDKNLVHYSGYRESELLHPVSLLLKYLREPQSQEALYKKYAAKKYLRISSFVANWISKGGRVPSIDNPAENRV